MAKQKKTWKYEDRENVSWATLTNQIKLKLRQGKYAITFEECSFMFKSITDKMLMNFKLHEGNIVKKTLFI